MLDAAAEQVVGLELELVAVEIEGPQTHPERTLHVDGDPGKREATFFVDVGPVDLEDLRVDEHVELAFLLAGGDVDDTDPLAAPDLVGREADPGGRVHRLDHVLDEPAQVVVDPLDRDGGPEQHGVGVENDG